MAMLTALNASCATWAADAALTARLAPQTIVHGDFHGGNHLFNPHDACRVVDFQFLGTGRVADEVAYFFTLSFDPASEAEAELLTSTITRWSRQGCTAIPTGNSCTSTACPR